MSEHVTALSDTTFDEEIGAASEPVLVDFWAEWCGPCKMVAPILDEIAGQEGKIRIAKLNVDDNPNIARRFEVMSIPTMILFKDGQAEKRLWAPGARARSCRSSASTCRPVPPSNGSIPVEPRSAATGDHRTPWMTCSPSNPATPATGT